MPDKELDKFLLDRFVDGLNPELLQSVSCVGLCRTFDEAVCAFAGYEEMSSDQKAKKAEGARKPFACPLTTTNSAAVDPVELFQRLEKGQQEGFSSLGEHLRSMKDSIECFDNLTSIPFATLPRGSCRRRTGCFGHLYIWRPRWREKHKPGRFLRRWRGVVPGFPVAPVQRGLRSRKSPATDCSFECRSVRNDPRRALRNCAGRRAACSLDMAHAALSCSSKICSRRRRRLVRSELA